MFKTNTFFFLFSFLIPILFAVCHSRVERGKIRLKLQLLEETVLPSSCYEPLETLFLEALNEQKVGTG